MNLSASLWSKLEMLHQKLGFRVLGLLALSACAAAEPPRPASAAAPTIVLRPAPRACNQTTLDSATPWRGEIVRRESVTVQTVPGSTLMRNEWVLCGAMDSSECMAWAQSAARKRVGRTGLEFELSEGRSERGTLWVVEVDDREEAILTPDNRSFVELFRKMFEHGKSPVLKYRERIREARYGRVEIAYKKPSAELYVEEPASKWSIRIDADPQSVVEATLALEDLEPLGVTFDHDAWVELSELAARLDGSGETQTTQIRINPKLGPRKPAQAPPLVVSVLARCQR